MAGFKGLGVVRVALASAVVAAGLGHASVHAADGKSLFTAKACMGCHGAEGKQPIAPNYPKLDGQNADYLYNQMRDIKTGKRRNGLAATMKAIVATVSDDELRAIADYLAAVK